MRSPIAPCALSAVGALSILFAAPGASAAPPTWVVDPAGSRLGFTAGFNGQAVKGLFRRWSAQIVFDPADLADSRIAADIDVGSAATGDAARDQALPTSDFFSAKLFPHAVFHSRRIRAAGPHRFVADGELTLRNVTRPISLAFDLTIAGDIARATGAAPLDRLVFGVGQGQWRSTEAIPARVEVDLALAARKR